MLKLRTLTCRPKFTLTLFKEGSEKVKNKFDNYDKYGSLGGIAGLYAGWLVIAVIDVTLSDRATCWYNTFRLADFFIKNNN